MTVVDTWEVQKAVYAKLVADNVAGGRVFDRRTDNVAFPNVSFGAAIDLNDDTMDSDGITHTLTIDIWDEPRNSGDNHGFKNVKQEKAAIRASLHQQKLTVTGLASCICFVTGGPDFTDGLSRHSVLRVECKCRV